MVLDSPPALITAAPRRMRDGDGSVRVSADVDGADPLWFSVAAEHEDLLGDRADHIAVALLLPAMRYGRDLHVGGTVTDSLLHRLNHDLQPLVRSVHAAYRRVSVTADDAVPAGSAPPGVVTGFSGGVDSFATLMEYALRPGVPPDMRVTHLVNNNVGAHGEGGGALWDARYRALAPLAADLGLPFLRVDSNVGAHYPGMGFMETVTFRNAAAVHLLGGGVGRSYHASEGAYRNVRMPPPHGDIGLAGPMTFPLLSTPALTLESTGSGLSRIERTLALAGMRHSRYLDVCIDPDPARTTNCSRCWKCMRTMLTLDVAGRLDEFVPQVFRREPYLARRAAYYVELLASEEPNDIELVEFADARGWRWGHVARPRAGVRRAARATRDAGRSLRRRIRPDTA
ncbi:hypothetical protein LXM50_10695 [Microbacterium sp. Au-Mic1]|uniref:hypothetical protein n=1 Tax=Microbacterium sp. Au-Mic1 TaxID=2906457 RepID=UPI001E3042DA|nr:hypothetical protein [Microbacterium sp. Au-Mic1]MCE4026439.1 hypothetical protein [Microbacterium sp. Au-Mic1]